MSRPQEALEDRGVGIIDPAERELIVAEPGQSFRWLEHDYPVALARWNYHPELEIHLIREGAGRYIVGDGVGTFTAGHVALVGSGLPHDWISDLEPGEVIEGRDAVIQFQAEWVRAGAGTMAELQHVEPLLRDASRGIEFLGETATRARALIELVGTSRGAERLGHFLVLLGVLAASPQRERHYLANEWFTTPESNAAALAIEEGLDYVMRNIGGHVRLAEAARRARMSESTFSKYFSKAAGLTFTELVRKLRLARAQRLLQQTDTPIAQICHDCGYANLSNFNRQFRAQVGMTPREFRRMAHRTRAGT